jgi:hypothetical protein
LDNDIEKHIAPGMLGSQSQGGLYAGPTSAAINLASVSILMRSASATSHQVSHRAKLELPKKSKVARTVRILERSSQFQIMIVIYLNVSLPWTSLMGWSSFILTTATGSTGMSIRLHSLTTGDDLRMEAHLIALYSLLYASSWRWRYTTSLRIILCSNPSPKLTKN